MSLIGDQIKQLREYSKELEGSCSPSESYMVKQAADTIEELSAKLHASQMERSLQYYNDGWIPCEDRLPSEKEKEKNKFVVEFIVIIKGANRPTSLYYNFVSKTWVDERYNTYDVVYWRTFPDPPKLCQLTKAKNIF